MTHWCEACMTDHDDWLERIRALEAELAYWLRESTKWNAERDALKLIQTKHEEAVAKLKTGLAKWADDCAVHVEENLALKATETKLNEKLSDAGFQMRELARAKNDEIDRLKARVAELEARIEHLKAHGVDSTKCLDDEPTFILDGGGRESGGVGSQQLDSAVANPAACLDPQHGHIYGCPSCGFGWTELDKECDG